MRSPHADDSADELRADVAASNLPRNLAAQREGDADGRIEMSTPTGSECQYQDREDRAGRQRIVQLFLRSTGKRVPSRALAATRHTGRIIRKIKGWDVNLHGTALSPSRSGGDRAKWERAAHYRQGDEIP
jgi:hypothetical protein